MTGSINDKIVRAWKAGASNAELSRRFGRSKIQIGRLIAEARKNGAVREVEPTDRRRTLTPLSQFHRRLGVRVTRWRNEQGWGEQPVAAARHLEISLNRLSSIERGIYDVTLSEMDLLCSRLGITLEDLVRGLDNGHIPENDCGAVREVNA